MKTITAFTALHLHIFLFNTAQGKDQKYMDTL